MTLIRVEDVPCGIYFSTDDGVYRRQQGKHGEVQGVLIRTHKVTSFERGILVERLKMEDMIERCAVLERENTEMGQALHDARQDGDHARWIEHGAALARKQVIFEAEHFRGYPSREANHFTDDLILMVSKFGHVLSDLPPDRLKAENDEAREILREVSTWLGVSSKLQDAALMDRVTRFLYGTSVARETDPVIRGNFQTPIECDNARCDNRTERIHRCIRCGDFICQQRHDLVDDVECDQCREYCGICGNRIPDCDCAATGRR